MIVVGSGHCRRSWDISMVVVIYQELCLPVRYDLV